MTKRIFRAICLASLAVFLSGVALIMGVLYDYFSSLSRQQLRTQTALAAQGVAGMGADYFASLSPGDCRITWIGTDGSVLYDSAAGSAEMENHLQRQEIIQASAQGYGESERYSTTLMERLLYSAQRLPDGSYLRLSVSQSSVVTLLLGMLQPIAVIALAAVVLSLLLASRISKKIISPLNSLDLDHPLSNEGYDELSPLLRRIDSQQRQLRRQSDELSRRRDEFEAVTGSMSEGLVLLGGSGDILSINPTASALLSATPDCIGRSLLTVSRTPAVQELLSGALEGRRGERTVPLAGGSYQLDMSPIISDGKTAGAVLLLFDVTEKERAEEMRREFTANVSHELKTPLQTISGCAELLCSGMVKSEDVDRFQRQIYQESQRMIRLVEDIIKLSCLDEGAGDMKREDTDLYALAHQAVESLAVQAENAGVTVSLSGGSAVINGIPQLLGGIVYNLCDNAIKYNRPGGHVYVTVSPEAEDVLLRVKDDGIGIPPEHQSRVFERFYRVDKSHSREVGGTGLGLSIVKHAARIHNAKIELKSAPGAGTDITVRFPR